MAGVIKMAEFERNQPPPKAIYALVGLVIVVILGWGVFISFLRGIAEFGYF